MSFVSPGAYAREIDLSLYAEQLSQTVFAVAGTFNKGVIGTATLIHNLGELQNTFGSPIDSDTYSQAWLACREFLKRGNQLYVTRCDSTATPAAYSYSSLLSASDQYITTASDGATGIVGGRTLTSAGAGFAAAGVLAGDCLQINDVSTPADNGYYLIVTVNPTTLVVDRDWPTGSLSSLDYTVWSARIEGGADGATGASTGRTFTSAGSTFTTNAVALNDILYICDSVTTDDNGFYRILTVPGQTSVTVDRDFPVGSKASLDFVIFSELAGGSNGSTAVAGEFSSASNKFADHDVQAGDILLIKDSVDTGNNGYYYVTGVKLGATDTTVTVAIAAWPAGALTGLDFEIWPGSVALKGLTKGTWIDSYLATPSRNAGDPLNVDILLTDSTGSFSYEKIYNVDRTNIESEVDTYSSYFEATVKSNRMEPCPGFSIQFTGGVNGTASIADADYIGNAVTKTGLYSFLNTEELDINVVACPGVYSQNVTDFLVYLAETRGDTIALIDSPDWASIDSVQDILNWHNGTGGLGRTTALNSSYAALYWTWQQVYDDVNDADRWIAPSGHAAAVYAYNDKVQGEWFAPAGLKRGKVIGSKDVRYSPNQDDRDSLYASGQNVNALVNFIGEGVFIWGQKTLQRASTALNRISVRRMLNYVKKILATATRYLVFDPNDTVLEDEFKQLAEPVLKNVLARRGLREFQIVSATTDADRDNNKAVFNIFIKPMSTAEVIEMVMIITAQGVSFSELTV